MCMFDSPTTCTINSIPEPPLQITVFRARTKSLELPIYYTGTKLYTLGITAMNISLIILCLFLSYIFLYFFSWLHVMAFNCVVFLLHTLMGPLWIYEKFYALCEQFYVLLLFMVTHPYISSFLVIFVCLWSFVRGVISICYSESNSQQVNDIREEIMELNGKVDSLDMKIEEVLASLARIEVELS